MDLGLQDRVALITAASEGLGFACALRLANAGCKVALCARREESLEKAKAAIVSVTKADVLAIKADLLKGEDLKALVQTVEERFNRIDILVGNSGHIPYGSLFELSESDWYHAFDLLVMSMVRLTRLVIPLMRVQKKGNIVFLTSSVAKEPAPHLLLSNVFRVGVVALAKSLSQRFAADNIRVNAVTLGYFDTGRVQKRVDDVVKQKGLSRKDAAREIAGDIPLGRIGTAEECADLVAFLVSRRSEFLTGSTLQIDGGKSHGIF
jgi:3-oxoacyl-[acyl-carrier protein] reductase